MKRVALLATGGTIASVLTGGSSRRYELAGRGAAALVAAVPALAQLAALEPIDRTELSSADITASVLLDLARQVAELAARPDLDAIVITHGTDTLEETAWLLTLVVGVDKPIVLTGAMRPADALGADGPANLLAALAVAVAPDAGGRGALVVLNGRIHAARGVRKAHTTALDAFIGGLIGCVEGRSVAFTAERRRPLPLRIDLSALRAFPDVWLLPLYADLPEALATAVDAARPAGVVLVCTGDGSVPTARRDWVRRLEADGVVVVRCSRTLGGCVWPSELPGLAGLDLTPQKARVLLMAALAAGAARDEIAALLQQ